MKKFYILAFALGAFAFTSNAQVELSDNFDSYNLGDVSPQSANWRTWSGVGSSDEDADVTDDEANSPDNSLVITGNGITDMILLTPSAPMDGVYTIKWNALIPAGNSGYFNMQASLTPAGTDWVQALMGGNVYFNCDGASGGSGSVSGAIDCIPVAGDATFSYPEDQWFEVRAIYDIDNQTWGMEIDGVEQFTGYPLEFGTQGFVELAGLDFFSASANDLMYIDDVVCAVGLLSTTDFSESKFSVYPNPVTDILNIKSASSVDNVTVYDLLGKVVLQANPGKISPSIDMSGLSSGAYLVQVTIGKATKTVKVLK
jgi:hypothetical protein